MTGERVVSAIRDVFKRRADADLLVGARTGHRWTYRRASEDAARIAAALEADGVSRGGRVNVLMENSPAVVLTYLAAASIGATVVPVNRNAAADEIDYALRTMGGELTVVSPRTHQRVTGRRLCVTTQGGELRIDGNTPLGGVAHFFEGVADDDRFSITLTSGSTARPKGVVHTIGTLFGNALAFNAHVGAGSETVFLHGLPMSYMAGLLNSIVCPLMAGGTIVVEEEFGARTFLAPWAVARRFDVNTMWATPTVLALILELDRSGEGVEHCRQTGMRIFVGTAPLPSDLRKRFESRYGVPLRTSYGLSELLLLTVRRPEHREIADANGTPLSGVELRTSSEGEIIVRTPYASPGYVGGPPAPDWFSTGDLGDLLEDGALVITGRKKDVIITGGVNVSPVAVEDAMRTHPLVDDAVAVGVPDEILGEVVAVVVELAPGADAAMVRQELMTKYSARLGASQRPRHIVVSGRIPRSPTGKVRRADVRALVTSAVVPLS